MTLSQLITNFDLKKSLKKKKVPNNIKLGSKINYD